MGAMSYDLLFWRSPPHHAPDAILDALQEDEPVDGLEPFTRAEVTAAFFETMDVREDELGLLGRGFELGLADGARYLQVCCSWRVLDGTDTLDALVRVGQRLGCRVFDPQLGRYLTGAPTAAERSAGRALRDAGADHARAELGLDPVRLDRGFDAVARKLAAPIVAATPDERAASFEGARTWTTPEDLAEPAFEAIERFLVEVPGQGIARGHEFHPANASSRRGVYAALDRDVLGIDVVVARLESTFASGSGSSTHRLLALVEGRPGFLRPTGREQGEEEGRRLTRMTGFACERFGPTASASRRASDPPRELGPVVARALAAALERARSGDDRALRRALTVLCSLANEGHATVELSPPDGVSAIEVYEAGAALFVWSQRAGVAYTSEVRLALPDDGALRVTIVDHERSARSFDVPAPFGPSFV